MGAKLADARLRGFEIVDADLTAQCGSRPGAEGPALDDVMPTEVVLSDEGAGGQRRGGAFAIVVRGEEAENALQALDVPLLNSKSPSLRAKGRMPEPAQSIQTV